MCSCKNSAKILQNAQKKIFPLCKIFAKILQILDLHTDFRPREESVLLQSQLQVAS